MLGSDVARACREYGFTCRAYDLPEFDITHPEQIREVVDTSEVIINCAAYTDVDKAETEVEPAYKINAESAGRLGTLAKKSGRWVLHISTDFVFDGTLDRAYVETDLPNPINCYGKTKLAGEQLLAKSGCKHCIIRTEWTYGKNGDNFISKIISRAKPGKKMRVVDDQIGSPTSTIELAQTLCKLLPARPKGIFHFAASGYVSRFEVAKFVLEKLGISVHLSRCKSSDYQMPAKRPLNSRFDCQKIQGLLGETIEKWQGPLERYLKDL